MSNEFGNPKFEKFIREEIEYARKYSFKENFNPQVLNAMNHKIALLTEFNNGIIQFKFSEAWKYAERSIKQIEETNPNITGHLIGLNVDYKSGNFSKIDIPD